MAKYRGTGRNHPIDEAVGREIRKRRILAGFSQTDLANHLGVSFQQIQKYERGANRVSASALYEIATALDVPVSELFAGIEADAPSEPNERQRLGMEMMRRFNALPNHLQRGVANLLATMSTTEPAE